MRTRLENPGVMRITVVYLGGSRGQTGRDKEELDLPAGASVGQAAEEVLRRYPKLAPLAHSVRWARNYEFVSAEEPLAEGDELALLPPVAGGAPRAQLTSEPVGTDEVVARVHHPGAGAVVVFVGTVRDHAHGKAVERLEYEAYEPMAQRQLERIAEQCEAERPGTRVAMVHRHGKLGVGEVSVVIAVSSAHRGDAFEGCRECLERIKTDVPIWKREVGPDGESWVGWGGG